MRFASSLLRWICSFVLTAAVAFGAPSLMENLDRGVVAIRTSPTSTFVSWRYLGTDSSDVAFNLYRATGAGAPMKLNGSPLTSVTNFTDNGTDATQTNTYTVRPVLYGVELAASPAFTIPAGAAAQPYLNLALQIPAGGVTPTGEAYTYSANDLSIGDLDGDGVYEIVVKWDPSNAKDNAQSGYTGNTIMDAYKLDGTRLWRIDLGKNIRAGAHYSDFLVFDFDGDGKSELVCKTAPGSKDGAGTFIATTPARFTGSMPSFDPNVDYRNSGGYILKGYEFFTVFNGLTGVELTSAFYVVPRNDDINSENVSPWGDNYGNRVDRFLACVAYLDGSRPSFVLCRGYYTRAVLAAWDWRDGALTQRWVFDTGHTGTPSPYADWRGQGAHSITVGDVDGDGKDEITYGAAAIDDNGTGLYSTRLAHGDALHMSDMDPNRPGLEVWMVHESPSNYGPNGLEFRDARTGGLIFGVDGQGSDVGRGVAGDIDPRTIGYEMWGSRGGLYDVKGNLITNSRPGQQNFMVWWDGDLLRELLDNVTVSKWNWLTNSASSLLAPAGVSSNNSTKATPNLSADILGDWREEIVWRTTNSSALRIYTTTTPTTYRIPTLMHDRMYRLAIAWQNVGYNQPPHPGFYLGEGMTPPPQPDIVTSLSTLLGPPAPVLTTLTSDGGAVGDLLTNDSTLVLSGTVQPGATVNVSRLGLGLVGSTLADGSGNWSFNYTGTPLPDGQNTFIFNATDALANTGPNSTPYHVIIDTASPGAPSISSVATHGANLLISGTAEAGSTVSVTVDGGSAVGSAIADAGGAWSITTLGVLSPGSHTFVAVATDPASNASAPSAPVSVDTSETAPVVVSITSDTGILLADGVTSDTTLVFAGTATPGRTVNLIRVGMGSLGTAVADVSGNWTFDATGTPLADGAYIFAATALTAGGGTSPFSPAFPVTIDTAAPTVVSIVRQAPANFATAYDTFTFRVAFSEPVSGLVAGDFAPLFAGGLSGTISSVTPVNSTVYDVVFTGLTGQGTARLDLPLGGVVDAAGNPNAAYSAGEIYTRTFTGDGVWIKSESGGLWSDLANWSYGIIAAGVGATGDFNVLEVMDDNVVHLDSPRTVGQLIFGDSDPVSPANWIVDGNGSAANILTLAVPSGAPTVTVNNTTTVATLSVSLAGSAGLTKAGVGTLVINSPSTLNGVLNVSGGALQIDPGAVFTSAAANTSGGTQMFVTGGSYTASGLFTVNAASNSLFHVSGGTVALNGGIRNSNNDSATIRISGGTVTAANLTLQRGSYTTGAPSYSTGFIVTGGTTTIGPGTIGIGTNNSSSSMSIEGGSLTATGPVIVGWQASSTRGGAVRVTAGTFNVTDTVDGLVLARVPSGGNTNNVAVATFSGGTSTIEKIKLGYDAAVTAGSATVTINGGALYLGSGGIVRNGTSAFTFAVNLTSGILGAKADWATTTPLTLSNGSTLAVRSADAAGVARQITFGGVVSGSGALTKTGDGTLILGAPNTFTGAVALNAGTLAVNGSVAAGGAFTIASGGTLAGTGTVTRTVTLNSGGSVSPAGAGVAGTLAATNLTWNAGGTLRFDLGATSDRLALTGALTKGSAGAYPFVFNPVTPLTIGAVHTLATFGSTTFTASDFSASGLNGGVGVFSFDGNALKFTITSDGSGLAAFDAWMAPFGLPAGQNGPLDDPDGDGLSNLLESILALNPAVAGVDGIVITKVALGGEEYPALQFRRRQSIGDVAVSVRAASSLDFAVNLGVVEVSAVPQGDGTHLVITRSVIPLSQQPKQFLRLFANLP